MSSDDTPLTLVLASRNQHKVDEFRALFAAALPGVSVQGITSDAPVESGVTFEQNALVKARSAADETGLPSFADDSGLIVDVLGNAPGVFSARWAGSASSDEANRSLLLQQLADVPVEHRSARFVCALALVVPKDHDPDGSGGQLTVRGEWHGQLATEEAGDHGFGYDPIFIPAGFAITAAELRPDVKNEHSHRARAFEQFAPAVREVFGL